MNAGWDSVELESSLGKIFKKIPSLNASHKGDLSCFQSSESRCCAWAGIENNEGRRNWKGGMCWDSLTQLLEVKEATKWDLCLGRLDVLRAQVCPARDVRMVRQRRVQGGVSKGEQTYQDSCMCKTLSSVSSSKPTSCPWWGCEAVTLPLLCSQIHSWEVGPERARPVHAEGQTVLCFHW